MSRRPNLWRDQSAAGAAEFALILPVLLLFLLGLIDTGRFIWEYNQAEKATQMGVRYAVSTRPVLETLESYSFSIDGGLVQGTAIPPGEFDSATCDETGCTCAPSGSGFCNALVYDSEAFTNIVNRMATMYSAVQPENVTIEYRNVGIGYAGDPNGPDVAPLVTVLLTDPRVQFRPITLLVFGGEIAMPEFRAALTLEDGSGDVAN